MNDPLESRLNEAIEQGVKMTRQEMYKDIEEKITWAPYASNWNNTLESLQDCLEEIGYSLILKETHER